MIAEAPFANGRTLPLSNVMEQRCIPHVPEVIIRDAWVPGDLRARIDAYNPRTQLGRIIRDCFRFLPPEQARALLETITRVVVYESKLSVAVWRHRDSPHLTPEGNLEMYGVVSRRLVTDVGVDKLEDAFRNGFELENFNYHGIGTGGAAEAVGNTALTTELTTQYNPDNTRATGTQSAPSANVYRTVGVNTVDASVSITEHGLLSQAATGGGSLWDRHLFTAIALASADSLQSTYDGTFTSGG